MFKFLSIISILFLQSSALAQATVSSSLDQIITGIEILEGNKDPKCYATASRLERRVWTGAKISK